MDQVDHCDCATPSGLNALVLATLRLFVAPETIIGQISTRLWVCSLAVTYFYSCFNVDCPLIIRMSILRWLTLFLLRLADKVKLRLDGQSA